MFDDRTKSHYDFHKIDNQARTKVIVEEEQKNQNKNLSDAHKKLFGEIQKKSHEEIKQEFKSDIIKHNENITPLSQMPSSSYLKSFKNKVISDLDINENESTNNNEIDFSSLVESVNLIKADDVKINKEIKNVAPKPKKNYSFRIKLVTGVYCILVALFGGWVISNTINIANTNASLYETTTKTSEVNSNILEIVSDIKQLDNASSNPEDETIVVKIITEEIDISPEAITQPNEYKQESNWFDAVCNWISGIFGG